MRSAKDIANARANAISEREKETESATESPAEEKDSLDISDSPESSELGEPETAAGGERTPKEWRERLKNLVAGAAEQVIGGERGKQLKKERLEGYLGGRSKELQEKARGLGPLGFEAASSVVERYNKLNWKTKLAVTGALMLGVSATAIAMPLVSSALTTALYGQRLVGAIGLGMNKRKALDTKIAANPEHWMANKSEFVKNTYAIALATAYLAGTSLAVYGGVEFLRSLGIGDLLGGAPDTPDTEPPHTEPNVAEAPENAAGEPPVADGQEGAQSDDMPASEEPAPVSGEPASQADMPASTEGTVASSTDSAPATPAGEPTNPDIKPIDAKSEILTKEAPDGNLAAKEFGAEYAEPEAAPEDLSAQEWRAEYAGPAHHPGAPDWRAEHAEADFAPETPAEASPPAEAAPQPPITEETVTAPNAVPADTLSATPEAPPIPTPEVNHFVVNAHGVEVTTSAPHIYADGGREHLFVYGGSPDQQARLIGQYFEDPAHANHTLYGADASNVSFRVPWHMVNGEVLPGEPIRTSGFFGFFSSFMEPPHPDEFTERIQ